MQNTMTRAELEQVKTDVESGVMISRETWMRVLDAALIAQATWKALNDVQWMNIVNHDHAWETHSKDDAVHGAVKMAEVKLREINMRADALYPGYQVPVKGEQP